jgi:excisionase family DNA binding protein
MNKNDAATFLEIGIRSLERYTGAGKVQAQKLKVKTGFALDYDPAELERFKAVLEAERQEAGQGSPVSPTALAVRQPRTSHGTLANVAASVANGHGDAFTAAMVTQAIAVKLLLNLAECQALTGLSRATLRDAIESGDLKAKMIGKAWRVKRSDLEAWINAL